jgi:hypothetical protein
MSNITDHELTLDGRISAAGRGGGRSIWKDEARGLKRALDAALAAGAAPQHVYLDTIGAAKHLGTSPRTLETLRTVGGSPKFCRIGRVVRYRLDWLDEWAEQRAVVSTSEETARRRA